VACKIGPGPIPEQATTTISSSAADAEALERGELDPMQAFMSGRMRVAGDMTLMMQMQAIQMQVAAARAKRPEAAARSLATPGWIG
jgi:putative sterol carrier protein